MIRCPSYDDYQQAALTMADWSSLSSTVEITQVHQHFEREDDLIGTIGDCHIVVAMRERTPSGITLRAFAIEAADYDGYAQCVD